ncbi:MAG: biotin synthase [Simplicispira suum]|uniref:biotin synthase n=1 Tax=Simplicispira suum TaxID=2109915 RepID=UPI001C6B74B0|nr:biotin synthase [Simplicispira suum]MBW7832755.1 biotin synthase [Simplicispira suum]
MASDLPPTIDPVAAARWHERAPALSPWLHEEVARRMEQRLGWIREAPRAWCHWDPVRGGLEAHALLRQRYPDVPCLVNETARHRQAAAHEALAPAWWSAERWGRGAVTFGAPQKGSVQMLWANMLLHSEADPRALIGAWQRALDVDGYLMFSCFGPDTLRELRAVYQKQGWPEPAHAFTDMHDWGDMLIEAGFAEPVMDMERITLSFATPERLLQELRELGSNLHPARHPALRGRRWHRTLCQALATDLALPDADGQLALSFEIVYGHAFKPVPRVPVAAHSAVSLDEMRSLLKSKVPRT